MATLSGGQASVIAGGTSSFGQFRLTTFVDSTPRPSRTTAPSPVPGTARSDELAQPTSQHGENGSTMSSSHSLAVFSNTLQPSSQTFAPPPPILVATAAQSTAAAHNGFGILDLASPPVREGRLGPHRDGRVRNPVPLKLKGRTDDKKGNFSVMHMEMSGSGGPNDIPRSEAAQRTSENTAQAAKAASSDSYKAVKRRRIETSMNVQSTQDERIAQTLPTFPTLPPQEAPHRTRVLTSEETKYEQARLLTLLRSINPLTVVDQICKALAFFGGIPGAPPPENGSFPESADANGSGTLFVGWLSEIFPELDRKAWRPEILQPREVNRGPRPRGRPKGSKASKVRKDKGIKKGPKNSNKGNAQGLKAATGPEVINNADEEWVDVTEMDAQIVGDVLSGPEGSGGGNGSGKGNGSASGNGPRGLATHVTTVSVEMLDIAHDDNMTHQSFENPSQAFSPGMTNMGKRRPGRPKGSRNKQRNVKQLDQDVVTSSPHEGGGSSSLSVTPESQRRQARPPPAPGLLNKNNSSHLTDHPMVGTPPKNTAGGSAQQSPQASVKRRPGQGQGQVLKDTESASIAVSQVPGLTAEEQAALDAFRMSQSTQKASKPPATNEKAKKGRPKSGVRPADEASSALSSILPSTTTDAMPVGSGKVNIQGVPTSQPTYKDSSPILPPPKRQRKVKDPTATPTKKTAQTTETSSSAPAPSPIVKSTTTSSDSVVSAVMPSTRPPAQGLEAHYERFANLQPQVDHQQHHQQNRHELNPATRSSPMQSASAYYQQSRHVPSPYDQQYSTHQTANPYQPALLPQTDSFRPNNQQHTTFPTQQQQASHPFNHFPNSSFIDIPALDSVANGTTNVGAYGQSISRSTANANFGAGAQMGNSFESMSDNDIRERLLRGIGRR